MFGKQLIRFILQKIDQSTFRKKGYATNAFYVERNYTLFDLMLETQIFHKFLNIELNF